MEDVDLDDLYGDDGFRPEEAQPDLCEDLYGDITEATAEQQLPSAFSLEKQIQVHKVGCAECDDAVTSCRLHPGMTLVLRLPQVEVAERARLEAELAAHQEEFHNRRAQVMDLTKRACQLLMTARLELQRKREMVADLERRAAGGSRALKEGARPMAPERRPEAASREASRSQRARTSPVPAVPSSESRRRDDDQHGARRDQRGAGSGGRREDDPRDQRRGGARDERREDSRDERRDGRWDGQRRRDDDDRRDDHRRREDDRLQDEQRRDERRREEPWRDEHRDDRRDERRDERRGGRRDELEQRFERRRDGSR